MALSEVRAAITDCVRTVPGVMQVPDAPPPSINDARMLIVYPRPGTSTPMQHGGRTNQPVMQQQDQMVIEWHLKTALDQIDYFLDVSVPLLDQVRDMLWSSYVKHRFNGTVTLLTAINTDHFGEMGWAQEDTWGFRLTLDLMHAAEIPAGKDVT